MEVEGSGNLANINHLPNNATFVRSRLSIHHTSLRFFAVGMLSDQSNIQLPIQTGAVNQYVISITIYDCRESLNFAHITAYPQFVEELGPGSIVVVVFEFRVHRSSLSPTTISLDTKFVAVLHDAPIIHEPSLDLPTSPFNTSLPHPICCCPTFAKFM
ncbi:hypothetical protein BC829DRAFT_446825 [Chytridium lagenaria]|nr:hypothetical protein BC829DRAFT_446825 [Chytridium lagenaria]